MIKHILSVSFPFLFCISFILLQTFYDTGALPVQPLWGVANQKIELSNRKLFMILTRFEHLVLAPVHNHIGTVCSVALL